MVWMLRQTVPVLEHVGAFAFNKDYYYFKTNGVTDNLCQDKFDVDTSKFKSSVVEPRPITPKEATMWGYNMLSEEPYTFTDLFTKTVGAFELLGLIPYSDPDCTQVALTPLVNQSIYLRAYYDATPSTNYKVKWAWRGNGDNSFTDLTELIGFTNTPLTLKFSAPTEYVQIKVTVVKASDDSILQVMTVGFNLRKEDYKDKYNSQQIIYHLSKCQGMAHWKNRIGGVRGTRGLYYSIF